MKMMRMMKVFYFPCLANEKDNPRNDYPDEPGSEVSVLVFLQMINFDACIIFHLSFALYTSPSAICIASSILISKDEDFFGDEDGDSNGDGDGDGDGYGRHGLSLWGAYREAPDSEDDED